jgi:hypothetical protein
MWCCGLLRKAKAQLLFFHPPQSHQPTPHFSFSKTKTMVTWCTFSCVLLFSPKNACWRWNVRSSRFEKGIIWFDGAALRPNRRLELCMLHRASSFPPEVIT